MVVLRPWDRIHRKPGECDRQPAGDQDPPGDAVPTGLAPPEARCELEHAQDGIGGAVTRARRPASATIAPIERSSTPLRPSAIATPVGMAVRKHRRTQAQLPSARPQLV